MAESLDAANWLWSPRHRVSSSIRSDILLASISSFQSPVSGRSGALLLSEAPTNLVETKREALILLFDCHGRDSGGRKSRRT